MIDIIKEFTMLDLLGLIFPGSLMMVIICAEYKVWDTVQRFVGKDMAVGVQTVIILFGGYALGMLMHEVCDMLESIFWSSPRFNPKAAVLLEKGDSGFLHKIVIENKKKKSAKTQNVDGNGNALSAGQNNSEKTAAEQTLNMGAESSPPVLNENEEEKETKRSFFRRHLDNIRNRTYIFYEKIYDHLPRYSFFRSIVGVPMSFALMAALSIAGLFAMEMIKKAKPEAFDSCFISLMIFAVPILFVAASLGWTKASFRFFIRRKFSELFRGKKIKSCKEIVQASDMIFADILTEYKFKTSGKGIDASKVNFFDGFRTMARNLLLEAYLIYVLSHYTDGYFSKIFSKTITSWPVTLVCFIVLMLLLVRYWRYSYLRYKYIYEDVQYIEEHKDNKDKEDKDKKDAKETVQLVCPLAPQQTSAVREPNSEPDKQSA